MCWRSPAKATNRASYQLGLVKEMRARDKVLIIAFAVCAAFSFGDHLAFTINFQPSLVAPILVGKLTGGLCGFGLARWLSVPKALELLHRAIEQLGLSLRAYNKVLRISRTIADLDTEDQVHVKHVAEAVQYRLLDREDPNVKKTQLRRATPSA